MEDSESTHGDEISRGDLLKVAGLLGAGGALALGLPSTARANHGGGHAAYMQAYVRGTGDVAGLNLLVQAAASSIEHFTAIGTTTVAPLGADAATGIKGFGFDVELDAAVASNNKDKVKGKNFSFCQLEYTLGGISGPAAGPTFWPPNGPDAVRLQGTAVSAVDPANVGAPVKIKVSTASPLDASHPICLITFDFAGFIFKGRGLAFVNN